MSAPLRRNFCWSLAGNAFYAASQFCVLVMLAKLGSAALVGRYSLALAICAPVVLFTNLKLAEVQATDVAGEFRWRDYLGLRLVSVPLALLTVFCITIVSGYTIETLLVVWGVAAAKGAEALSDLSWGSYLYAERNELVARSQIARGVALVLAFATGVGLFRSLPLAVLLMVGLWTLVAVSDLRSAARVMKSTLRLGFDRGRLWLLTLRALPLGVTVTLGSLQLNLPRYFIEMELGESALGIFAGLSYVLVLGGLVLRSVSMAVTPRLAKLWFSNDKNGFLQLLARVAGLATCFGIAGVPIAWWFGKPILWLLFDPAFAERSDLLVLLMVAAALTWASLFFGAAINAMRCFRVQVPVHAASLAAAVVGCLLWLPTYGLTGGAMALILGALTTLILFVPIVGFALRKSPQHRGAVH